MGWTMAEGGVMPQSTSRIMPPPTPVITASTVIPNMSMRLARPTTVPEKAKAMVPSISKIIQVVDIGASENQVNDEIGKSDECIGQRVDHFIHNACKYDDHEHQKSVTGVEIFIVESTGNNRESRNDLHSIWRFFIWQDLHYREIYTMEREHSKP